MSFVGEVAEIPIGQGGFNGTKNFSRVRPDQLIAAENVTYENGTLQKEGGATKYNSTALSGTPTIIGGHDWVPASGTQRMVVVADDGAIYKDSGSGDFAVTLKSGLTSVTDETVPVFVQGGKEVAANDPKLFIFIPNNQVQVLEEDGATTGDITSPPTDWGSSYPTFGFIHEGRLMGGGNPNDPHRIYYSTLTDHENIAGGGTISVYPGDGEKLVAGISFKGLAILFKQPFGVFVVDTSDATPANWRVTRLSKSLGLAGPLALSMMEDDVILMDTAGNIHLLSSVQEFGNLGAVPLSDTADLGPFIRTDLNLSKLALTRCVWYAAKREAIFTVASSNADLPDARLTADFNRSDIVRFRYTNRDTNIALWLRRDSDNLERPVCSDDIGFVWHLDQEVRSKDGEGYQTLFQTPHLDLSFLDPALGVLRKNGHFLEIVVEPKGNWNLTFDIIWDGLLRETKAFNMGVSGASLGSFMLGTDALAGEAIANRKRRITGGGRRISIRGRNNGAGEDFSLSRAYIHFTRGDERGAEN